MTKITKKLIIVSIAITMLLGAVAIMTGCDVSTDVTGCDASTWQQDFNTLEAQVTMLEQNGDVTPEQQIAGVQEQLDALESRANRTLAKFFHCQALDV